MRRFAAMSDAARLETGFDLLAWREELRRGPPTPQDGDLADWAVRLGVAGHDAVGSLLENVTAIQRGFPPPYSRPPEGLSGDNMMARAMAELAELGRAAAGTTSAIAIPETRDTDIEAIVRNLLWLLRRPLADQAGMLLGMLRGLAARPRIDYRAFAPAALSVLVPAIAAAALIDFAQHMRDLWDAPAGSPVLFHRAARFDRGGLGPYFANVDRLARHGRDVIALAGVARDAALNAGAVGNALTLAPWIALLSRGCGHALLRELIDDLGDAGACDLLSAILDGIVTYPAAEVPMPVVMRLRDAALDNADFALALRAQIAIARLRPDSELEMALLGAIQASGGAWRQAEATFRGWLAVSPGDGEVRQRLDALEAGRFEAFIVDRGFGSPPNRQIGRLLRRGILPDHHRRPGQRIDAVEVR